MVKWVRRYLVLGVIAVLLVACASKILQHPESDKLDFSKDFDKVVKIVPLTPTKEATPTHKKVKRRHKRRKRHYRHKRKEQVAKMSEVRQPTFEDSEGMDGRRPKIDPFQVGEKLTLAVSYFNIKAGSMTMEILPFVDVNGRKAYHFQYTAKSSSVFSVFYAVDDAAETFLDYENLVPSTYQLHVRESKQLREVRAFWDFKQKQANVWEKKITKEKGVEDKTTQWVLEDYAQNVFSAAYYMRIFKLYPGKKLAFYVADDGKNYLFKGEIIRREKLKTDIGVFNTVVLKPQFELDGVFKPVGDILIWMSDDDHKYLLRIESKIKIGKIVGQITGLVPGH